ncbi:MAG: Rid family hydrolase [Alphaproteobacteria bacterium]|jgi:enamine deaminase RidA (YjgF/YER057c/UK114 family)|nr:Rid family hydrolase [Alphaproteobacteria bacterium]
MANNRRINVGSGRPLEPLANYSRALRVNDMVLQSGTTAIDTEGNVIGEGDIAKQVDAIMDIAQGTMGQAGGRLDDVVRARIYVTDIALADQAGRALAKYFHDVRPAATLVQVSRLARPTQLIEIELDAVDGAKETAQRLSSGRPTEELYAYSRAVRVGERVFISGTTSLDDQGNVAHPGDLQAQAADIYRTILEVLDQAGAVPGDLVYSKSFVTDLAQAAGQTQARMDALGEIRPTATLLGVPGLIAPEMLVEIEAEAIIGAAASRQDIYSGDENEKPRGYARAVAVGDVIHVSGCTSMDGAGNVRAPGDWAAQYDICHEAVAAALAQAGASLDDVVRRRMFTIAAAEQNRAYGEGPAWFADSRPVSMGCRISGLAKPEMLIEMDAWAVKGAHKDIEWLGPEDAV